MSTFRGLKCDGCGTALTWIITPNLSVTKAGMQQRAREAGWQSPTKDGRDLCDGCRRPDGKAAAAAAVARGKARREAEREARNERARRSLRGG